jgi:CDP-glucose 4,6-dehydratase
MNNNFWKNKKVLITGHTGFKGGWLSIWLKMLGAKVYGYSLSPPAGPSLFKFTKLKSYINKSYIGNIQNKIYLNKVFLKINPDILFHLAAQPSVRVSYKQSLETVKTNVLGTSNILEILKKYKKLRAVVMVATDKVYENSEKKISFKETSKLGGKDLYSASKAASEIIVNAYNKSFFSKSKVFIASARSGNVIGGGDWTKDRIVPDCLGAFEKNKKLSIRYPNSVRPFQHVLEPIYGYIVLAEKLYKRGSKFAEAWNFGPKKSNTTKVIDLAYKIKKLMKSNSEIFVSKKKHPHEARYLSLDSSKSKKFLKWKKFLNLNQTLKLTIEWFYDYKSNANLRNTCIKQINFFSNLINE